MAHFVQTAVMNVMRFVELPPHIFVIDVLTLLSLISFAEAFAVCLVQMYVVHDGKEEY